MENLNDRFITNENTPLVVAAPGHAFTHKSDNLS